MICDMGAAIVTLYHFKEKKKLFTGCVYVSLFKGSGLMGLGL